MKDNLVFILTFTFLGIIMCVFFYWLFNPRVHTFSYSDAEVISKKKYCEENDMELFIARNMSGRVVELGCKVKD